MEGNKKQGLSASSFTADLFGATDASPSPTAGVFASMFPPPSTVAGRNSSSSEVIGSLPKQAPENQGTSACNIAGKNRSANFQERKMEPCHLSSSLYYGGQDIYSQSPNTYTSGLHPNIKKDTGEDDPNGNNSQSASRGNWWQGSLYY
ncbi:Plant/T7H20-70 protein [Quillaja saponaria]|uniref:Plant/T7H20-70 protein n=1 Tax=Quillaja saponaria TaxID=32244 RepID=A0AAD7VLX4_QUISA|nr:Plant/T7H20-70 protein [Quillaja saponaria]